MIDSLSGNKLFDFDSNILVQVFIIYLDDNILRTEEKMVIFIIGNVMITGLKKIQYKVIQMNIMK